MKKINWTLVFLLIFNLAVWATICLTVRNCGGAINISISGVTESILKDAPPQKGGKTANAI